MQEEKKKKKKLLYDDIETAKRIRKPRGSKNNKLEIQINHRANFFLGNNHLTV